MAASSFRRFAVVVAMCRPPLRQDANTKQTLPLGFLSLDQAVAAMQYGSRPFGFKKAAAGRRFFLDGADRNRLKG